MSATTIDFEHLSERSQERVRRRIKAPGDDTLVVAKPGRGWKIFALLAAISLAHSAITKADDPYTDLANKVLWAVAASALGAWALGNLIDRWRSPIPPITYLTRLHLVRVDRGQVQFRLWVRRVVNLEARRTDQGQVNGVILKFGEKDVEVLPTKNAEQAERLRLFLVKSEEMVIDAAQRSDLEALRELDDFLDIDRASDAPKPRWERTSFGLKVAFLAFALAMLSMAWLNQAHALAIDGAAWGRATQMATANAYRYYLQEPVAHRWREEARDSIAVLYARASSAYSSALSNGHDPQAAAAIEDLLTHARETGRYVVPVSFSGTSRVSDGQGQAYEYRDGYSLYFFGDAFSTERQREREGEVLSAIQQALKSAVPEDVLSLAPASEFQRPVVNVEYAVVETNAVYVESRRGSGLFDMTPTGRAFRGVRFHWNFTISSPSQSRRYQLRMQSEPAVSIDTRSEGSGPTPVSTIYGYMANSAFADFQSTLATRLGLRLQSSTSP